MFNIDVNYYLPASGWADQNVDVTPSKSLSEQSKDELSSLYFTKYQCSLPKHITITTSSTDKGGHGGTLRLECLEKGRQVFLFLKPLDKIELANYLYLQEAREKENASSLVNHMIHAYGSIEINGVHYLVMDDLSSPTLNKTTLLDIKLAGKVPGINPIASLNEIKDTGRKKGFFDYIQMWLGARMSPHFMVASGMKFLRFFNYRKSGVHLANALSTCQKEKVASLIANLKNMKTAIAQSNIAFIGASIVIIKDGEGNLTPKLIDPAHILLNNSEAKNQENNGISSENRKFSYGSPNEYEKRKKSNEIALEKIIQAVEKVHDSIGSKPLSLIKS